MQKKRIVLLALLFFSGVSILIAGSDKSSRLVKEAWQAWEKNDLSLVEKKFQQAIKADKNNARAYLGLSYLYNLQEKHDRAWSVYKNVLHIEEDIYPYIYAAWTTRKMRDRNFTIRKEVKELVEDLTNQADSSGTLKAMAHQELAEYYQHRNELGKSKKHYEKMNTVTDWKVIGPFENISASGFDNVFPPETEFDESKIYSGKNGVPVNWFQIPAIRDNYWIDFRRYFAFLEAIYYANTFVYSPVKQTVQIRMGTSGSLKAFLNDELMVQVFEERNNDLDTYMGETRLQAGWNRLLLKCGFSELQNCNFMVRITDVRGEAVPGLQISTESQSYPKAPGASARMLINFAEAYFKKKIQQQPAHLENYLLLADCYLRNDKAIEAELILRDALARSPNCAVLQNHQLEAYNRGDKWDEYATTMERIYTLDKNIPRVLKYKFDKFIKREDLDRAEELLKRLEALMPESEWAYQMQLSFYEKKKQIGKLFEVTNQAFQKYPHNLTFALIKAALDYQITKSYEGAIQIIADLLKTNYDISVLTILANMHLKNADLESWRKCYEEAVQIDPAGTGLYSKMGNTYFELKDYDEAEKAIKKALSICPNCPQYWAKLGEIYRIKNKLDLSKQAYRKALNFQPTLYEARNALRELEKKKPLFSSFNEADIQALMAISPSASEYPNDGAVILMKDTKNIVYGRGASESTTELLVKVFNNRGIDAYKEYWIQYNAYSQDLTVEKAVAIKADGSEVKADIDVNHIVFKSLEPDDYIHLKWKLKNYYGGKLSQHFWDSFNFNGYYPIKNIKYSVLVPDDFDLKHHAKNFELQPQITITDDGKLYQWSLSDEPAIEYEYYMPGLEDIGKVLYVSSIPDWSFIVNWYSDLARTKTRTSFEIKEQVAALFDEGKNYSAEEKIKTIYDFITENIRYSSVSFRQSGFIPQKARDVLVTKIGDCKDVATLNIAMLREVGIDAHYVLLNHKDSGRNEHILPSIAFNHCIVAVETETGLKYLDPTAYNYPVNTLPYMDIDGFALRIDSEAVNPFYFKAEHLMPNNLTRHSQVAFHDDSLFVQSNIIRSGDLGAVMRETYRNKSQKERINILTEILSKKFPGVKITKFEFENLDELEPEVHYTYHFSVPDYISRSDQHMFLKLPWSDALTGNQALSYESREYPYQYWPWGDTTVQYIEMQIPSGYELLDEIKDVQLTSPIADYFRSVTISGDKLTAKRTFINKKHVVYPEDYAEFKEFYNRAIKEDSKQLLFRKLPTVVEK
ncbi:MAG: tetratricopeptide repeat protein [bacterium]